jgi:hypothetical protein
MTAEEGALREAIRLAVNRVLNDGELDSDRMRRVEFASRGGAELLAAVYPRGADMVLPSGGELAARIQAERYRQLGFTPEQMRPRPWDERQRQASADALTRLAALQGVGEDEEELEVEEIAVAVTPSRDIWLTVGLVWKVCNALDGSDGDVVEHLVELLNSCDARPDSAPDAIVPVNLGILHLAALALTDPAVIAKHPEAPQVADEIAKDVLEATAKLNEEALQNEFAAKVEAKA